MVFPSSGSLIRLGLPSTGSRWVGFPASSVLCRAPTSPCPSSPAHGFRGTLTSVTLLFRVLSSERLELRSFAESSSATPSPFRQKQGDSPVFLDHPHTYMRCPTTPAEVPRLDPARRESLPSAPRTASAPRYFSDFGAPMTEPAGSPCTLHPRRSPARAQHSVPTVGRTAGRTRTC